MIENKLTRVTDPNDPRRCQGTYSGGQCPYLALPGVPNCRLHRGDLQLKAKEREATRLYKAQVWASRIGEQADHDKVKSLREEIGIARITLEELLNLCTDGTMLLQYSNRINDSVTRIQKLVTACHQLELSSGQLLDKTAVLNIAATIVEIVSEHVTDSDALANISDRLIEVITNATSK